LNFSLPVVVQDVSDMDWFWLSPRRQLGREDIPAKLEKDVPSYAYD
jgi:hypothetical protein